MWLFERLNVPFSIVHISARCHKMPTVHKQHPDMHSAMHYCIQCSCSRCKHLAMSHYTLPALQKALSDEAVDTSGRESTQCPVSQPNIQGNPCATPPFLQRPASYNGSPLSRQTPHGSKALKTPTIQRSSARGLLHTTDPSGVKPTFFASFTLLHRLVPTCL